jgi:hypothetical protein
MKLSTLNATLREFAFFVVVYNTFHNRSGKKTRLLSVSLDKDGGFEIAILVRGSVVIMRQKEAAPNNSVWDRTSGDPFGDGWCFEHPAVRYRISGIATCCIEP